MSPIPVVWSPACRNHVPSAEVWVGVRTPGTEVPARVDVILGAVRSAGHPIVDAAAHPDSRLTGVHDLEMVEHLRTAHDRWTTSTIPAEAGQDQVVPYVFPTAAMLGGIPATAAAAVSGQAGAFCYDTMTVAGRGTWEAARAAVDCALTAADLVAGDAGAAYALCRPPGHHVTAGAYGGSCYLNNAALAAQAFRDSGHEQVSVVDVDAHHGNGTSAIFYGRADVSYGSVHVDPGSGWFPHFVGHADERGSGEGLGANLNLPLAPGAGDTEFVEGVARLLEAAAQQGASAMVVSLGVDAAVADPESPLRVTADGYHRAGKAIASMRLPTVLVQEGGYHLPSLGTLVTATLSAFG